MDHLTTFKLPCLDQSQSVFFEVLPGEIRDRVYTHTLSCFDDKSQLWDKNSSWVRPGYDAPQTVDAVLLQTCQRIYTEAWFRPWLSTTHSFWLAVAGRRPDDKQRTNESSLRVALPQLFQAHGRLELDHVRVFAQLWALEPGHQLRSVLSMPHFYPRTFTVTIRHHDWWMWEDDEHLHIEGHWVNNCRFPSSVTKIKLELESLQRKRNQIEYVADHIVKRWQFARQDDMVLTAKATDSEVRTWSGSSTWEGRRWIRDETKPETNDYYIKTVVFKPNHDVLLKDRLEADRAWCPGDAFQQITSSKPNLTTREMGKAGVQPGMTADEAKKAVDEHRQSADHNPNVSDEDSDDADDDDAYDSDYDDPDADDENDGDEYDDDIDGVGVGNVDEDTSTAEEISPEHSEP